MSDPTARIAGVGLGDGFGFPDAKFNNTFALPFPMANSAPALSSQLSIPGIGIADVNYRVS
jgi:hypothetical protein